MEFRAQARFMRVSPQKARLVLDLIKGRRVEDALNTLMFTKKRVAPTIEKLLRSAVENANYMSTEKGVDVDLDSLYVKRAVANDGPRMKRIRPAPMGRAYRYVRRISHIEIALAERGKSGEAVATVVGEQRQAAPAKRTGKPKSKTVSKAKAKKPAKKKAAAKK
ncbi:MAG TPA: 50S ribosomal protein L22 [Terriglobales bacterium]|nr:50S ribosomal protein L22 [Terriglobales bacterium]